MDKPEKLKLKTEDLTNENVEKLGELFPDILTEVEKDGKLIKKIDLEKLKELVGDFADKDSEIYQLTWAGKQNSKRVANEPTTKTLRPVIADSVDFENTENLYIEGDNLEVLKILRKSYTNSIKAIYIDPPYNTRKDFVYKDNFSMSKEDYEAEAGAVDEEGNRLIKNTGTDGRFHSNWLNMMYPRLQLAYKLLKKDGVIFISIDDNEVDNLRKICDEIFGESNFVESFIWRRRKTQANLAKHTAPVHDYILCYSKSKDNLVINKLPYSKKFIEKTFKNPDDDPKGPYQTGPLARPANSKNREYELLMPNGRKITAKWSCSQDTFNKYVAENRLVIPRGGEGMPRIKIYLSELPGQIPNSWLDNIASNDEASKEIESLFGSNAYFDFPKPSKLIKHLLILGSNKEDIILDFFSGSATTAHSVMQLNAEDNGGRKFIMVQLPEEVEEGTEAFKAGYKNICEIGKERIRRAAKKIQEENKDKDLSNVDFGFRVFKLDESNMKDEFYQNLTQSTLLKRSEMIKPDRTEDDLIYQTLLDMGVKLSQKVVKKSIDNKNIFVVDDDFLVGCFDENITQKAIDEIVKIKPLRLVFKETCFKTDADMINAMEVFKHKIFDSNQEQFSNNVRLL